MPIDVLVLSTCAVTQGCTDSIALSCNFVVLLHMMEAGMFI